MTDKVKGVIEAFKDNGPVKGKFGTQYRISVTVDDERYSGFFSKSAEKLGIEEGRVCLFNYIEKGEYKNIDTKSFKVSEPVESDDADEDEAPKAKPAPAKAAAPFVKKDIDRNIARGQAVNNAVLLFVNGKAPDLRSALRTAIELHAVAEGFFDKLLAGVDIATALKATATASEPVKATPAPAKPKAKAAPVAAPVEEPEEEEEAPPPKVKAKPKQKAPPPDEEVETTEAVGDPDFDDEIPF